MAKNRTLWLIGIVVFLNRSVFSAIDPTVLPVNYGQYGGSVAVGPQNTLVTWIDYRRTEDLAHDIFGTRIGPLGETLDGDGVSIATDASGAAAVAALKDMFLVAWAKGPNIYARRMRASGELLDAQPIVISANPGHPFPELVYLELSAAADGTNFWVSWTDERSIPEGTPEYLRYDYQDIYAARISRAGRVLEPRGIRICGRGGRQEAPRLSPKADFIVWTDYRGGRLSIFGARLHPRGLSLDPNGFPIASSTNLYMTAADVSGNGRGWLVAWGDMAGIHGAQVNRKAVAGPPFNIAQTTERVAPQVATAGQDCIVVWQSGASTVGSRVTVGKSVGAIVTVATDSAGANYFSFGGIAGNGSRFCVTGATAPINGSWFYNDVWFGTFTGSLIR